MRETLQSIGAASHDPMAVFLLMASYLTGGSLGLAIIAMAAILTTGYLYHQKALNRRQLTIIAEKEAAYRYQQADNPTGERPRNSTWPALPIAWIGYALIYPFLYFGLAWLTDPSYRLPNWPPVGNVSLPYDDSFLWLHLSQPDETYALAGAAFVIASIRTAISWRSRNAESDTQANLLFPAWIIWLWPIAIAMMCAILPSGIALYWIASKITQIAIKTVGNHTSLLPAPPEPIPMPRHLSRF